MIIVLLIILFFAGFVFITMKINNLKDRAKQHVLKNTGFSSSDINSKIVGSLEKKHINKFIEEHNSFTEESLKELLKRYSEQIIQKTSINEFSQNVYAKIQNDSKLEKMQNMKYLRTNINFYANSKLNVIVIYTDNKDEYNIYLICSVLGERIQVDKYQISKGEVVGF